MVWISHLFEIKGEINAVSNGSVLNEGDTGGDLETGTAIWQDFSAESCGQLCKRWFVTSQHLNIFAFPWCTDIENTLVNCSFTLTLYSIISVFLNFNDVCNVLSVGIKGDSMRMLPLINLIFSALVIYQCESDWLSWIVVRNKKDRGDCLWRTGFPPYTPFGALSRMSGSGKLGICSVMYWVFWQTLWVSRKQVISYVAVFRGSLQVFSFLSVI